MTRNNDELQAEREKFENLYFAGTQSESASYEVAQALDSEGVEEATVTIRLRPNDGKHIGNDFEVDVFPNSGQGISDKTWALLMQQVSAKTRHFDLLGRSEAEKCQRNSEAQIEEAETRRLQSYGEHSKPVRLVFNIETTQAEMINIWISEIRSKYDLQGLSDIGVIQWALSGWGLSYKIEQRLETLSKKPLTPAKQRKVKERKHSKWGHSDRSVQVVPGNKVLEFKRK